MKSPEQASPAGRAIDWRQLLRWGDLEARRRRRVQRGLARLPAWVFSLIAAVGLVVLVVRGIGGFGAALAGDATLVGTSHFWLGAVVAAHAVAMFGAPFRMYWRRDSALLGRLSIPGGALFRLALVRSLRATLLVAAPCALAGLAFGPWLSWQLAGRHLALVGVAAAGCGLLLPAVTLAAGGVVASNQAQAVLANLGGGEFQAPKTSWLGLLPGLASSAVILVVIAGADWALGGERTAIGDPRLVLGGAVAVSAIAALWALRAADRTMLAALREVAALDQERLAHVDLTRESWLERGWAAATVRDPGARQIYRKDVRLAHRRYPIPFFVGLVGVVALWIVAAVAPADLLSWSAAISAGLAAYGLVMARRRVIPPIEHPRFLATLAVSPGHAVAAKRSQGLLWIVAYQLVGGAPVVARAADVATTAAILGAIAVASVIAVVAIKS